MKILYLAHNEQDYGCYYMYNGLCELLSEDNIVVYPPKLSYLGICDKYYTLDGGKRGMTNTASYVRVRNPKIWTLEEIIENIKSFDFMILSSPRTYAIRALKFIRKYFNGNPLPLIYTDHEDSEIVRYDLIDEFKPDVIFKRELTKPIDNIYPLPFSSCIPYLNRKFDDQTKTIDVFGVFGYTHPLRKNIVDLLLGKKNELGNVCTTIDIPVDIRAGKYTNMMGYNDYLKSIAASKIAISVRGHGRDTVRYWEIPSFETLFMLHDPGIIMPNPFIDKKHCVYFKDINDLDEKIKYYLKHDDERIRIAKAGKEHLFNYHTNIERVKWFLLKIKDKLK